MLKIRAKKGSVEVEYEYGKDLFTEHQQRILKQVVESVIDIYEEEYDEKENNQQE